MNKGQFRKLFDLTGRVAVVTGASGLLGRYFCAGLADCGASIAVVDLHATDVEALAMELRDVFGVKSLGVVCDVSKPTDVKSAADKIERELGVVDVLHNNAQATRKKPEAFFAKLEDYTPEAWREVMAVNLDGAFLVAQEFGARMAGRGRGSIIQTASIYGVVGPDQRIYEGSEYLGRAINTPPVYSASKAGLIGLTRYLATYWGPKGVRANTITPGGVSSGQNSTFQERYSARVPLGRMAEAHEIVGPVVFLASDASSYINGQNIIVDGGLSAW